jgi:hypothetical protein
LAFETPPYAMDGTTEDAEQFRRALGTLIGSAGGIVASGDCAVSQQSTPNMSVQIAAGQVWVPGTSTASQGPYYSRNGASVTVVIAASNPSNPRIDTVIAQVQDAAYAGTLKQIAPAVITGTPTVGATLSNLSGAGAVPASSLVLAYVLVPAGATSIVTANILNVAPLARPGLGTEWAYSQITAPVNVTSTNEASGTVILSPPAFTPDGGPVLVEFFCPYVNVPTAAIGNSVAVCLFEGSTQITRLAYTSDLNTSQQQVAALNAKYRFTPTAAAHTYTVTAFVPNTTGTPQIGAGGGGTGGYPPAFVRFTKAS